MRKQMKLFAALAAAATMTLGSAFASMAANHGWIDVQNYYYYYDENGNMVTSQWVTSGDNQFWMNSDGRMAVQDWIECADGWYYVNSEGAMVKNQWVPSGHDWYYVGEDGKMLTNCWLTLDGKTFWFESDGKAAKGWRQIDGQYYFFNKHDCTMAANGETWDHYTVGEDGSWN